jgi:hypothetical protein
VRVGESDGEGAAHSPPDYEWGDPPELGTEPTVIGRTTANVNKWLIFKSCFGYWCLATPRVWRGELLGHQSVITHHGSFEDCVAAMCAGEGLT